MTILLAIIASALAMSLIVGIRYLIVSGAFDVATRAKYPGLYVGLTPQIRREIAWSLASALIYGIPAGVIAWGWQNRGWTAIYADINTWPLWYAPALGFSVSVLARYMVLLDASLDAHAARVPASRTPSITKAARPPPGRRWRFTRSRQSPAL